METSNTPIRPNEVGAYGDLAARPNPNGLVILNEPSLEGRFTVIAFKLRRAPTWEEIDAEQKKARAIVLTKAAAEHMMAARAKRGLS